MHLNAFVIWGFWGFKIIDRKRSPRLKRASRVEDLWSCQTLKMCNHEQDFVIAKALKTLNENTESENLVPATNQSISKAAAKYELQVLGALAIAQVWILSPLVVLCTELTMVTGPVQRHNLCGSLFQANTSNFSSAFRFIRLSYQVFPQCLARLFYCHTPLSAGSSIAHSKAPAP